MKRMVVMMAAWLAATGMSARADDKPSAEHLAAAQELLVSLQLDKTFGPMVEKMVDLQIKQNPVIAPFRKVMLEFFNRYISWESLKDDMAKIYAEEFTIGELKDLAVFYRTPTGRKAAEKLPQLAIKGGELGAQRVQEHMAELNQMIAEEVERMKAIPK